MNSRDLALIDFVNPSIWVQTSNTAKKICSKEYYTQQLNSSSCLVAHIRITQKSERVHHFYFIYFFGNFSVFLRSMLVIGEVVVMPRGWYHCVLNQAGQLHRAETSTNTKN